MSARQRKRLLELERQRAREAEAAKNDGDFNEEDEDEDDDDEEEESDGGAVKSSGFAFLASDSDSGSDSDSDSDAEKDAEAEPKKTTPPSPSPSPPPPPPPSTTNSKKKGKKTKDDKKKGEDEDDALEAAIAQAKAEAAAQAAKTKASGGMTNKLAALLAVRNVRELNPDYEMRQKLGKFGAAAGPEPSVGAGAGVGRGGAAARMKKPHRAIFCNMNPDETFMVPTYASGHGGAHMIRIDEDPDGSSVFSFEVSSSYRAAHQEFEVCQASMDANRIVVFLQHHPWHVPALLQMYEVYLQTSQLETAEMMLRCALYTLESWLHPRFPELLQEGRCRLRGGGDNFDAASANLNATFERALFKSMLLSSRRGCHMSAFSLAKTMYNLDPKADRRFALLAVDLLAVRANQLDFVISFFDECSTARALPGIWYSRALALFRLGQEAKARKAAVEALGRFPGALVEIIGTLRAADPNNSIGTDPMVHSALEKCTAAHRASGSSQAEEKLYAFIARMGVDVFKSPIGNGNQASAATWFAFQATSADFGAADDPDALASDAMVRERYAQVRFGEFADEVGVVNVVDDGQEMAGADGADAADVGDFADAAPGFGFVEGENGEIAMAGDPPAQGADDGESLWQRMLAMFIPGRNAEGTDSENLDVD
ncbi:Transcription factor 25 [Hondaea fermentalgiana]|uniref:Transcription factor 25 n=1 Tax=Hondaea fermentalgiana TaxID=2315210 RepID=A0A2R5GCM9_9STRA|nr:Transcription factor 25 [Hondaea fermentalgiana]|eukprot:GBG28737.1 Transcription factor 25 [Hondaea fermentalgiana]